MKTRKKSRTSCEENENANRGGLAFSLAFSLVFSPGGQAAPDVALRFVDFKDLSYLRKQDRVILWKTLNQVFVHGRF